MSQYTLLIANADQVAGEFLAIQLDADGHTAHQADSAEAVIAKLSTHAIDVLLLSDLARSGDALALLRTLRAGQLHARVHPAQPAITLGEPDELSTLRAYEAGSDHHLARDSGYLVVRASIQAVARRTVEQITSRHLHIGDLHIDTAARSADVNGTAVKLSRIEFELLVKLASDPSKVFTKAELKRTIWGQTGPARDRTLDSHVCRLRQHLGAAGAQLVHNRWGTGYSLSSTR